MILNAPQLSQENEQPKDLVVGVTLHKIIINI